MTAINRVEVPVPNPGEIVVFYVSPHRLLETFSAIQNLGFGYYAQPSSEGEHVPISIYLIPSVEANI